MNCTSPIEKELKQAKIDLNNNDFKITLERYFNRLKTFL